MMKIRQMEEAYQESLKLTEAIPTESNDRIPLTKDLTGIVEKLAKIKGRYNFDEQQVTLQKIPNSSVAVFQSHSAEKRRDNMQAQVFKTILAYKYFCYVSYVLANVNLKSLVEKKGMHYAVY